MKTLNTFLGDYSNLTSDNYQCAEMNSLIFKSARAISDEYDACEATSRKRFEDLQLAEAKCEELQAQLSAMKQERDDIQLRLHAVDHAYNEQQKSPALADVLKANHNLMETIIRQRQFIRTLYTSRNKKKAK